MAEDNPVVGLVETPWTASTTATEEGLRRRSTSTSTTSASSSMANEYTTSDAPPSISSKESFPVDNVKSSHDSSLLPRQMQDDYYSCNICFDAAIEPVLTLCGHLYCWPCLHQWLDAQRLNPLCPVCKAGCGSDKVIPVYGRGREATDPR
ncbi:hypothetical protein BDF22DRAFT_664174 [Syncephalis plumigaleata]|nr:hypothetical protein BDF22DRAFT_664174 [Syncephalis plumigaleata]